MAGSQDPFDYTATLNVPGFVPLKRVVMDLLRKWTADGRTAQAAYLRTSWDRFERELRVIAERTARAAEVNIKDAEVTTRVRPDTGGDGGPRLESFIGISRPVDIIPGAVLINDEQVLEQNVPWWWTNEEGYSGHVGREIRGVFMPGGVPPNQNDFRAQPLFRPLGKGPKGVIRNPIPERRFVRDGYQASRGQWHAQIRAAEDRFIAALRQAHLSVASSAARP